MASFYEDGHLNGFAFEKKNHTQNMAHAQKSLVFGLIYSANAFLWHFAGRPDLYSNDRNR